MMITTGSFPKSLLGSKPKVKKAPKIATLKQAVAILEKPKKVKKGK